YPLLLGGFEMKYERLFATTFAAALALLGGCSSEARVDGTGGNGSSASAGSGGGGPVCGDGVIGGDERCDGSDLGGATCASIKGAGYFARPGQALGCKPDCTFDTSACTNACILDAPGSTLDSCVLQ